MIRLLVTLFVLLSILSQDTHAKWFGNRSRTPRPQRASSAQTASVPNLYRTPYPTSTGPMSIGMFSYPNGNYPRPGNFDPYRFDNYVYDPYRFGSFHEPDLLNDPYFRERHRYDSHFPGRRQTGR
ncbi:MAG: hypothetical protein KDB00_16740 [Planctomycetales bacterium]|nr:hypothetical protein [Planctomycetales bacterium]